MQTVTQKLFYLLRHNRWDCGSSFEAKFYAKSFFLIFGVIQTVMQTVKETFITYLRHINWDLKYYAIIILPFASKSMRLWRKKMYSTLCSIQFVMQKSISPITFNNLWGNVWRKCDGKIILPFASQSMRLWQVPFLKLFFAWQAALSNDIKSKSENSEN